MTSSIKKYLAEIGKKGGSAGRGASKSRGNSEYYKSLRAKRKPRKKKEDKPE
jgi:hypothetical protein